MRNLLLLILLASGTALASGPVINEFMASNDSFYPDNCDFDDYSDWIEIYNPDSFAVDLTDYYLTDDLTLPLKWKIPDGTSIPPHGYFMVRADGFNAGPGESHIRGYWDWGSTFVTRRYHAPFKLGAGGESIGIYRVTTSPTDTTLIPVGAIWKYRDLGTDPGPDWMKLTYDDTSWTSGAAELGYGDGDETTIVSYGPNAADKYPTTYFRHHFTVTDPSLLGDIRFNVKVDDGAILYLNGTEVARLHVTDGAKTYLDYSGYAGGEYGFEPVDIPASVFRAGENVLAVEVHQADPGSSDISMAAALIVSEINPADVVLVDAISNFPSQVTDVSYGRDPASTNGWSFFAEPTPEGSNSTEALAQFVEASAVTASLDSGFYTAGQSVSLSSTGAGETIRYTLDGSVPTSGSTAYSSALPISNTTILRARSFASGKIPGPVLTRTFFVGENPTLPVFSLVTDPENLFDGTIGIYSNTDTYYNISGFGAGYYPLKGREVPVRLEMFEADQSPAFAVNAGVRIAGENVWTKAQKPLNVYMRSKYGDDLINYQMFPGEPVATFGEFSLRNGGDDWEETMLRDAMMPSILEEQMDAGLYSYRPSILFINGAFWGVYNIRKRFDPLYFANEHQLSEDDYDQLKYANDFVNQIYAKLQADAGTTEAYESFLAYCTTNNTADPAVYSQIESQMDVDSFIDYIVATDYAVNTSWQHNREFWSGHTPGSKWQWIINDFDRGFSNANGSIIDDFRDNYDLFQRLRINSDFLNRLLQRYAAHLSSTFYPQRISDKLDILTAEQDAEVARHQARWPGSMASRTAQIAAIKQFAVNRRAQAVYRLQLELGLALGTADLTVNRSHSDGGRVLIAGVPMAPEYTSTATMFKNTPFELTAEPAPGYAFSGWSTGSTNSTIELTLTGAQSITANFTPGAETIIPSTISVDTTLSPDGSPYSVTNDLIVEAGHTLTLGPGVTLNMPKDTSIIVHGMFRARGTTNQPVEIVARTGARWGNLSFVDATGPSVLNHVTIRGASASRQDPVNLKAAVSGYNSTVLLNHVDIDALQPVFARYGSTTLRDCTIHIQFTGDGVNIKSGAGLVKNSTFTGNNAPDTDAIDFDNVVGGQIIGNRIYAFKGYNSDAIDIGEGCQNLMVVSNRIFNITDKGVSVGQASVAFIERNLIVDCDMGVGIKDTGSTAHIDQNTFARCNTGVASYEKNVGNGGGIAFIDNCIFSRSKDEPVFVDLLSTLTVDYSLSDTLPLAGTGNLLIDPLFADAGGWDFSLTEASPAIDAGDPAHELDGDGSRADMGAYYTFSPDDYPYFIPNLVVVNEVLAHSHDIAPDWIELYNSSSKPVDLGGWYLSDDPDTPFKYRISDGTTLPANGYAVFYEDLNFGAGSTDEGALIPFALSENGDTVSVYGPGNGLRPDYSEKETFGASVRGVTKGRYYKASTRTYNFVTMEDATPGAANSGPLVGPVVISEIMYHPPVGEAEYIELTNISSNQVVLYDSDVGAGWRMTKGIAHSFPIGSPLVMDPGEKIMLVRNAATFASEYTVPSGTQVYQWDAGMLDNGGETLELSMPGDTNDVGELQFIRIDRVDYTDDEPWPTGPDGSGTSLARINEYAYGNDFANWRESTATVGQTEFQLWLASQNLPVGQDGPYDDPDGDGIATTIEYACGTDPMAFSTMTGEYDIFPTPSVVTLMLPDVHSDLGYIIQRATDLMNPDWTDLVATVSVVGGQTIIDAVDPSEGDQGFYRFKVVLYNYDSFLTPFQLWAIEHSLSVGQNGPNDDPDGDRIPNAIEYACATDPMLLNASAIEYAIFPTPSVVSMVLPAVRTDLEYTIQKAISLPEPDWIDLFGTVYSEGGQTVIDAVDPSVGDHAYYRLKLMLYNP